jgi:hypothetical protein
MISRLCRVRKGRRNGANRFCKAFQLTVLIHPA